MEFKTLEVLNKYNRKTCESDFGTIFFYKVKALGTDDLSYFERIIAISFRFYVIPISKHLFN